MSIIRYKPVVLVPGVIALSAVYWLSQQNYLAFHVFAEMFSIVIAAAISIIACHTRRIHRNNFLLIVGTSFIFVSVLDLFHLLTFRGMGVFEGYGANVPTQFWVCARSLQIASFLLAFVLHGKPIQVGKLLGLYCAITAGFVAAVFAGFFPMCYSEQLGRLTAVKILIESLICMLALVCLWTVYKNKIGLKRRLRHYLLFSLGLFVLSELAFCLYFDVYGFFNLLGHLFKIGSFYYLYKAIVKTGLSRPYELLFADLSEARRTLERMNQELEKKVAERTAIAEQRANQLRALAAELLTAEQHEKKKLAHLLHDHLQQLLAAAKMRTAMMRRHAETAFLAESIDEVTDLLSESIQCSRELSVELSPPALNETGLTAGLEWLVQWFERKHSLEVAFKSTPEIRNELPEEIKHFVFSASREMLFNVVKHAQVNNARLKLTYRGGMLYAAVKDRGKGAIAAKSTAGGFGLFSIRERIELLGGELKIRSLAEKGTTALIKIPVRVKEFEADGQAEMRLGA